MKKIIASAVGLMLAGGVAATTASAVENQFGGYWRTRAFAQNDFTQVKVPVVVNGIPTTVNESDGSFWRVDNRTRLYYTAKFNDDFKFVNKFEFNTNWGDDNGGKVGADGTSIWRIKNSYADFTLGNTRTKLGIQAAVLSRGFIFDDDFSGIVVTPQFGNVSMPLGYIAVRTEDGGGADFDEGMFFVEANVKISDAMSIDPYFVWWSASSGEDSDFLPVGDADIYYIGADFDMKMDAASLWGTAIYNGGEIQDDNVDAWLFAAGVDAGIAHGQAFYATGDDNPFDEDSEGFTSAPGSSYYWSEIMGLGTFDNRASSGAPGNKISNVWAVNAGVTLKPADKMKIVADVWYAALTEDDEFGDTDLGIELDGKLTYALMDNLNADFVLAYLFAGDATGDDDVFEGGVRLSLSF